MMKVSNLTPEERRQYDIYQRNLHKMLCREEYVFDQGVEQGIEQGIERTKLETAKRLLAMGLSIRDVAKGADLDDSVVHKLA